MMLAGVRVLADAVAELADTVRATGADELADRLEVALADGVALLALTIDERAIILAALEDPPDGLVELRAVLLNEHEWRQHEGHRSVSGFLRHDLAGQRGTLQACCERWMIPRPGGQPCLGKCGERDSLMPRYSFRVLLALNLAPVQR